MDCRFTGFYYEIVVERVYVEGARAALVDMDYRFTGFYYDIVVEWVCFEAARAVFGGHVSGLLPVANSKFR